ncbi:MAG: heavy metal-binding domain-containing protein [Bdellovibrionota bacterium]|nr:MAG: heavy metal-binding domain-containing protein [Bdellovibrionota bacterium]
MIELGITLTLLLCGLVVGSLIERRHYESIREREFLTRRTPLVSHEQIADPMLVQEAALVVGNVVIGMDYFKWFAGWVRSVFGGRVTAYETLVDRARREAVLRMKDAAKGFDIIVNTRIESCSIGGGTGQRAGIPSIEVFAYGTALKYAPQESSQILQ